MEVFVMRASIFILLLGASTAILPPAMAADPHAAPAGGQGAALTLAPTLRAALVAEMAGLKTGVADISVFLASGEWDKAAERATRIRDSYIMKQKLSPADLEQLERSLPPDFVAMDERFHQHAEGLAQAARKRDQELAVFYFSRMLEGCGGCHARYATHTFPGYRATEPAPRAH